MVSEPSVHAIENLTFHRLGCKVSPFDYIEPELRPYTLSATNHLDDYLPAVKRQRQNGQKRIFLATSGKFKGNK